MGKNYMQEVAKMLGVELGEEFTIEGDGERWHLDNGGLYLEGSRRDFAALGFLLAGERKIIRLPWKPKNGELYVCMNAEYKHVAFVWENSKFDMEMYKLGNCFKTKEEITPEVVERYKQFLNNGERVEW